MPPIFSSVLELIKIVMISRYSSFYIKFLPCNTNFQNTDTAVFKLRYIEYLTELGISNTAQLYSSSKRIWRDSDNIPMPCTNHIAFEICGNVSLILHE